MGHHKNPPTTRTVDKRTCNRLCEVLYILITLLVTLKTLALLHETWDQVRIRRHFGLGPFAQCLLLSLCTVPSKTTGPSSMLLPGGDQESAHRTVADASYYARSRRRVPNANAPAGYCDRICCSIQQGWIETGNPTARTKEYHCKFPGADTHGRIDTILPIRYFHSNTP